MSISHEDTEARERIAALEEKLDRALVDQDYNTMIFKDEFADLKKEVGELDDKVIKLYDALLKFNDQEKRVAELEAQLARADKYINEDIGKLITASRTYI